MTTQQPEALRLANILRGIDTRSRFSNERLSSASDALENQHARITDLESQLAQRFDAADVATAAAQGFRDGVASVSAGSEPTEQQILEAAEKAGLWPNTVHSWIPAFHRYHKELAKAQPAPAQAAEPVAVVVPCYTPSGKRVALCSAKQDLPIGTKLYAAPQPSPTAPATQQPEGDVVAYLDVGANGYLDLGSELSEDALQQLPKGRHALVIAGTYGIDGYVAAPQPSYTAQAADSVQEDAARYRWLREGNDAKHGAAWHVAVNLYGCEWDAAIDAAMNKGASQ